MNKERFRQSQPVVYQTLSNALKKQNLAHAYLFTGPSGSQKEEAALLLAQSLVCTHCDEDGFACGQCEDCQRIEHRQSLDVQWIAPEKEVIKKQDITDLQAFFTRTGMESSGRRVYILEAFDSATAGSSNSLLKFIEEPKEGIYGILLAKERSAVLPTIQSRCQWISFRPQQSREIREEMETFLDAQSARVLSNYGYTIEQAKQWQEDGVLDMIRNAANQYVASWQEHETILDMQTVVFVPRSQWMDKQKVRLFIQWVHDLVRHETNNLSLNKQARVQGLLVRALDTLKSPVDLALFLDWLYSKIRKVVIE